MISDNLQNNIEQVFSKPDKNEWIDKRVKDLETKVLENANLPFKIIELKTKGFLAKVSGLYAFIALNHMPWKYGNINYWTIVASRLTGKKFYCQIHNITKDPLLSIIINGDIPQFKKIELLTDKIYRGIIIDKKNNGILVEIGYHFYWRRGSFVGFLHKSQFANSEGFTSCAIGDKIEILYQGMNEAGQFIYSQTNELVDWQNEIPQKLIGQVVLAQVIRKNNEIEPKFLINGKYKGKMIFPKNDSFFGTKNMAKKVKNNLKDGDIMRCEVIDFAKTARILKLKWISELDGEIVDIKDIKENNIENNNIIKDVADFDGEMIDIKNINENNIENNYTKNKITKTSIANNLDDNAIQKLLSIRDKI